MVAGDVSATEPQPTSVVAWACGASGARSGTPSECPDGVGPRLLVTFPDCWDGEHIDSDDHRSHVAYSHDGAVPDGPPDVDPAAAVRDRLSVGRDRRAVARLGRHRHRSRRLLEHVEPAQARDRGRRLPAPRADLLPRLTSTDGVRHHPLIATGPVQATDGADTISPGYGASAVGPDGGGPPGPPPPAMPPPPAAVVVSTPTDSVAW